jgi:hypothetical protein
MSKLSLLCSSILLATLITSCGNSGNKKVSETHEATANQAATENSQAAISVAKKYGIKSAIVTFESNGMGLTQKIVLYFDDFGAREMEEKYGQDNSVEEASLCDGKNRYTIVYKDKTAQNNGACYNGIAYKFDWIEVSKADQKYKPTKLTNQTIAGKDCESFSIESSGSPIIYAGWSNICFLIDQNTQFGRIVYKAISIDENASIPAEKFIVPADFQVK